jgi:hypothetical protein
MHWHDDQLGVDLRLSAQRALWGHVPASLRAVSLEMRGTAILFRAVFEPGAKDADRELLSIAAAEVVADFGAPTTIDEEFLDLAPPSMPPHLRYLVFLRAELPSHEDAG